MAKPKNLKACNWQIIPEQDGKHTPEPYKVLAQVRDKWHPDMGYAKIGLAWRKALKADKDGHLMLGKCVKQSELTREFAAYDFIIVLNREVWMDLGFSAEKKLALVDHEMCHAAQSLDEFGMQKYDERGRAIYRSRKHDIEEFRDVVTRHGCYKRDLELFAEALLKKKAMPLLAKLDEKPAPESRAN